VTARDHLLLLKHLDESVCPVLYGMVVSLKLRRELSSEVFGPDRLVLGASRWRWLIRLLDQIREISQREQRLIVSKHQNNQSGIFLK
jgi:hypothetical protein